MTTHLPFAAALAAVAVIVYMLAIALPDALAGEQGWQLATASAYSTQDSPGVEGCTGRPLRDDTLTFASLIVPCGAHVRFCTGGRCVIARRTDSGPYAGGRSFDLALGTARALGFPTPASFGVRTLRWRRLS